MVKEGKNDEIVFRQGDKSVFMNFFDGYSDSDISVLQCLVEFDVWQDVSYVLVDTNLTASQLERVLELYLAAGVVIKNGVDSLEWYECEYRLSTGFREVFEPLFRWVLASVGPLLEQEGVRE